MTQETFGTFLLTISNEIEEGKLKELKFLCKDIPKGVLEKIKKPCDLFDVLISKGKLSQHDTSLLQELLTGVGEVALCAKVTDYISQDCANHSCVTNAHAYGLPKETANFIGREKLVSDLAELLISQDKHMVVLLGPPGYGKSTVVTHVGYTLKERGVSVVFVSLRKITSMRCMGEEILRCIDPEYSSLSDNILGQTKHYLVNSVKNQTVLILDNSEDIQNSDSSVEFEAFIEYVATTAANMKVLFGTRKNFIAITFESETIQLSRLDDCSSISLLSYFASVEKDSSDDMKKLGIQCKGIPLLIKMAGRRVKYGYKASQLAEDLKSKPYDILDFKGDKVQDLTTSMRVFLKSFDREMLLSLVRLSNFATEFTAEDACKVFANIDRIQWTSMVCCLHENALLQPEGEHRYSLHPLLQMYCREDQQYLNITIEGQKSREAFTGHYLEELESIHKQFVSKEFQHALQRYDSIRMNLEQARENAVKLGTKKMKLRCIDAYNNSVNLLGKVMEPNHCLKVYQKLYEEADKLNDKRQMSECLISLGFMHLYEVGHQKFSPQAFGCLVDAVSLTQQFLSKKQRQTEAYAHCQSKLGLCYIAKPNSNSVDRKKGKQLMENAISIRNQLKDKVLLAASYCDKAIADRLSGDHARAIITLIEHCYPEYKDHLGDDHPWVASVLDYISDSCKVLGKLDEAVEYNKMSLSIRKNTLGRHQDTARSFVHLADLLNHPDSLSEALDNYKQALSIQEEVLGIHEDTTASLKAIDDILGKLGDHAEQEVIRKRADSTTYELNRYRKLQTQISQEMRSRTNSHLKREQFKLKVNTSMIGFFIALVIIIIAISFHFLFYRNTY